MSDVQNDIAKANGTPPVTAPRDAAQSADAREAAFFQATPELDVYESAAEYLVMLDVPGAAPESIDVQVLGTELFVRARQAPAPFDTDVALAAFERRIELPSEVDASSASAKLTNGTLEVRIQKSAAARRVKIAVNAN